jgi:flagellar protein FliS
MIPNQGAAQSDSYLLQRINSATPEQLCVIFIEGAQRFLMQAINAVKDRNIQDKARFVNRVSAIIEELTVQLNSDEENELVANLSRIYEWWMNQLFEGSRENNAEKLELVYAQMSSMKSAWEELIQKSQAASTAAPPANRLGAELIG